MGGRGGFSKYLFYFFAFNAVASLDNIYLQAGRVRPEVGGSRPN